MRPEVLARTTAPAPERVRTAGIAGLGAALPRTVVPNEDVAAGLGVDASWIERRTGIRARRRADADDTVVSLAAHAGSEALLWADVAAHEVDMVLVATFSADQVIPNAAPQVAYRLGANRAGASDVGAACAGFVSALGLGAGLIEAGRAENVLVVGSEILSRIVDSGDRRTAGLFGDGAGAALLAAGAAGRIGPMACGSDGSAAAFLHADHDERLIRMDGHETFKRAVSALGSCTREAVSRAHLEPGDIDLFVFHQANTRILRAVRDDLGEPEDRVLDVIARVGNTSAASIPLALVEASRSGLLRPGARVLLAAVGAGFAWGATVVEWGRA
ncbi:MAG: beta-ketoacyl-ACP synthase 3 [Actinomycetota bacterium]|nr:beta-ketoacyl-ACP synthase 3 [Actinomycetota bacterium]